MGQIGVIRYLAAARGAELLLLRLLEVVKFVTSTSFDRQRRGKQLAALHSLVNIPGVNRSENNILLGRDAEENLKRLFYEVASMTSKSIPSGLFLSVLKQESEIRVAQVMSSMGKRFDRGPLLPSTDSSPKHYVDQIFSVYAQWERSK